MLLSSIRTLIAGALLLGLTLPQAAMAKVNVFYGETVHVSTNNIKVRDPHNGEILSFEILPKFDQVFSSDGKTTYQMRHVHNGQYVAVIYDSKFIGMRHADKIYIMDNANQRLGSQ